MRVCISLGTCNINACLWKPIGSLFVPAAVPILPRVFGREEGEASPEGVPRAR